MENTRNLCTVSTSEVSDTTNFIVEDENDLKRIPKGDVLDFANMTVVDLYNLMGGDESATVNAQSLINAIAQKVASELLLKTDVVSQIVNDATKAASMAAVYGLKQTVDNLSSDLISRINNGLSTDILEYALSDNCKNGFTAGSFSGSNYTGALPDSNCKYGTWEIIKRNTTIMDVKVYTPVASTVWINSHNDNGWDGWNKVALKSDLTWKTLDTVAVSDNSPHEFSYSAINTYEFLVSYGQDNNGQSYGGGTVVIGIEEGKPCILPIYVDSGFVGTAYIYNDRTAQVIRVKRYSGNITQRFIIYYH